MAAVLVFVQLATGILLSFAFEPTSSGAYASILTLRGETPFGQLIRNIHYWSANLLVLIVFLHMLRVFFTGAFHAPRQINWIIGWVMCGIILFANFTGYLLPYDQLAYWAVTVATGMLEYIPLIGMKLQEFMRGGAETGPATMQIFFALHTGLLPIALVVLMAFHFWKIRKAGGVVIPRKPGEKHETPERVPTIPYLFLREVVTALVLIAFVLFLSVFVNAPLEAPANPGLSPNPTKAPWYFAGFQELLLHIHPTFAVCVVPLLLILALCVVPYMRYQEDTSGIWFISQKARRLTIFSSIASCVITALLIIFHDATFKRNSIAQSMPTVVGTGFVPVIALLCLLFAMYWFLKKRCAASNNEAVQNIFVILVAAFVMLTVVGAWFRGKDMALMLFG